MTTGNVSERSGAQLLNSSRVNHVNFNFIVKRLENCSDRHEDCIDCPELTVCVEAFDKRCSLGDMICPKCGKEVPITKFCSECGAKLSKKNEVTEGGDNES